MRPIADIAADLETGATTSRALTEDALARNITFQVSPNKVFSPLETIPVGFCQVAVREPTAHPKAVHCVIRCSNFRYIQRLHIDVLDTPSQ